MFNSDIFAATVKRMKGFQSVFVEEAKRGFSVTLSSTTANSVAQAIEDVTKQCDDLHTGYATIDSRLTAATKAVEELSVVNTQLEVKVKQLEGTIRSLSARKSQTQAPAEKQETTS